MNWQEIKQQIEGIHGNGPVLEKLCKLLDKGEAIAFVGAGASANPWPLWDNFLEGMVKYALDHGKINHDEADFFIKEAPSTQLETAQNLRNRLEDKLYFRYLTDTFKDKTSSKTGGAYTPVHKALLQLPIQNYLTLNYDAGLTNARTALYPEATTTYFFWDQEEARQILNNTDYKKLVLYAHGRHDRSDSIILTIDDYRRVYDTGIYTRTLNKLLTAKSLIFVGFGLSDPYIRQLFINVNKDFAEAMNHIAFVGLNEEEMKTIDMLRGRVENTYGAKIIFYPSENNNQVLTIWLEALAEKSQKSPGADKAERTKPIETPASLKRVLADNYVHNPTDDEKYQGRVGDIATLNRWGKDPVTRIIGITGIGGQGKTSLVGHWLKYSRDKDLENMPVFYWSFYEDLDVKKFFKKLYDYLQQVIRPTVKMEPLQSVLAAVREVRLLLVLDGLEVIQEEDDNRHHHGFIKDPLLLQFLNDWGRHIHQSLLIITSRFSYPELSKYSGVSFHQLNLLRLSNEDGAALLEKLGLWTNEKILFEDYVEKLYGHPLLLRVLAATVNRKCSGRLNEFDGYMILDAPSGEKLEDKVSHMFGFYEEQLQDGQKELLGVISLFKRPIETKSFLPLVKEMKALEGTPLVGMEEGEIQRQLDVLTRDFLVENTQEGITCHPVIRDYFRETLQIGGVRKEAADFLSKRPGSKQPQTIEEVRDLVDAVVLLCDAGEIKAAVDLVTSRLATGGYGFDVFSDLPAPVEGLECYLAFVKDEVRRKKLEKELGKAEVAFHMSGISRYNDLLGNLSQAQKWQYKELEIYRVNKDKTNQAIALCSISFIETGLGNIGEALNLVSQALDLSNQTRDSDDLNREWAYKSYYHHLLGKTDIACQGFEIALAYAQKARPDTKFLYSGDGHFQAELFIRLRTWDLFQQVNNWNIKECQKYFWNSSLATCHFLHGWAEAKQGNFDEAINSLKEADKILRTARIPQELCRLDWVWGLLAEAQGDCQKGMDKVNESLSVSADKGFRLWQADGLVLRGRLRIMQFKQEGEKDTELLERAGDDGHDALNIADDTGYIWAKIEALELLSSYHQTKATLPDSATEVEKEQYQRYSKEAASLQENLYLTKNQMKDLKILARKEFEKQTIGWN